MSAHVRTPGGYAEPEMYTALRLLCAEARLDPTGAVLLRGQTNAVLRLSGEPVVVKIARRGTPTHRVSQTVGLVQWLTALDFPTVKLHPIEQPVIVGEYVGTFYTYLPQPPDALRTVDLARPLQALHSIGPAPVALPALDAITAIKRSLAAAVTLSAADHRFLTKRVDQLANETVTLRYDHPTAVLHGDPQHGNALHHPDGGTMLCDWDSAATGQPEWDLVTIEIHNRRFGHSSENYREFSEAYGYDVTSWRGYRTLCDLRELRMVTTNARKSAHEADKMREISARIDGLRQQDHTQRWQIM